MMKNRGGGFGGMQQLMKQANQLQAKMKKKQEELALAEYEGSSGGGAVKTKISGEYKVLSIQIDPEILKENDCELLQDLVMTAVNDAILLAKSTSQKEMEKLTGGMSLPGLL